MSQRSGIGVGLRRQARARARADALGLLVALRLDDDTALLGALSAAVDGFASALGAQVAAMREDGSSWADVGAGLGVSRQAAYQRFGSAKPPAAENQPASVREILARARYVDVLPARKVIPGAVGDVANACATRHHARCKGWSFDEPCSCWCHA